MVNAKYRAGKGANGEKFDVKKGGFVESGDLPDVRVSCTTGCSKCVGDFEMHFKSYKFIAELNEENNTQQFQLVELWRTILNNFK